MHPRWLAVARNRFLANPAGDAALLRRFHEDGDDAAFECLLWRHGGMVLGTCERILRDKHLAEDAYQATFLILARKAGSVRGVLPAWLHKVARRVCLRLQKRRPERLNADVPGPDSRPALENREALAILDAEIARLPEKHRRVVVLCYLQNLTAEAAARELGIPRGTVLSRLDAARRKLQAALTRRGVAPLAILTIPLLHAQPSAALVFAARLAVRDFPAGTAPIAITELANEVLHMTTRQWIAGTALGVIALTFGATGVGLIYGDGPPAAQVVAQAPAEPPKPTQPKAPEDAAIAAKRKQLDQLEVSEAETKMRIEQIGQQLAKGKAQREVGISPSALQQAIDNIDLECLAKEEQAAVEKRALEKARSLLRDDQNYPVMAPTYDSIFGTSKNPEQGWYKTESGSTSLNKDAFPEVYAHIAALIRIRNEASQSDRDKSTEAAKEIRSRMSKLIESFQKDVFPEVQKKIVKLMQADTHEAMQRHVEAALAKVTASENFPKTVAKRRAELVERRAELVERLNRATAVSEDQKLLEDELQVLREFRKAVMKQRLLLKLELNGVKLPADGK